MTRKFCKIAANVMALFTLVRFWNIIWETDNYTILSWPDFIILMGCFLSVGTIIKFALPKNIPVLNYVHTLIISHSLL